MTPEEAVQMVGGWPEDRTVPKRLAAAIESARGEARQQIESLVEALMSASITEADFNLIFRYFK